MDETTWPIGVLGTACAKSPRGTFTFESSLSCDYLQNFLCIQLPSGHPPVSCIAQPGYCVGLQSAPLSPVCLEPAPMSFGFGVPGENHHEGYRKKKLFCFLPMTLFFFFFLSSYICTTTNPSASFSYPEGVGLCVWCRTWQ